MNTIESLTAATGEYRAGGTDLQQRLRSGVSRGPIVDLTGVPGLTETNWDEHGRARIGALVPIATVASDPRVRAAYPALALSAGALATPQIRAAGTLGGNLLQHNRCWYYRDPATNCLKKGGDCCPARAGNHLYGVCFDLGPCVAPHPSTLAMALLAHDAEVEINRSGHRPIAALYGDGSDGRHDHQLTDDELLTAVLMPAPITGEHAAYFRAIGRALAEWPLVETVTRLVVADDGTISFARVAVGGVAPVPLRLPHVEDALLGQPPSAETFERAAAQAPAGASPLPMTGYKVDLLPGTVLTTLERTLPGRG